MDGPAAPERVAVADVAEPQPVAAVVAAFDVDGTLTRRDCVGRFLVRLGGRRSLAMAVVRRPLGTVRARARLDRDGLKAIVAAGVFAGRAIEAVDVAGAAFAGEILARGMRADTVARLRWHQRCGHDVVLVSASLGPYLRPLGELLGVDGVLCTDVAHDGQRYGDVLDGANCRAEEKARRLRAWLSERGRDGAELWAYGDSRGDVALLAMAAHPLWVLDEPIDAAPAVAGTPDAAREPHVWAGAEGGGG